MSNRSKPEAHVSTLPSYSAAQEKGQSIFAHATSSGTQEQGAQGALYPAELVGGVVHCPVEMPAHRF
jgi:hypothetical protein